MTNYTISKVAILHSEKWLPPEIDWYPPRREKKSNENIYQIVKPVHFENKALLRFLNNKHNYNM